MRAAKILLATCVLFSLWTSFTLSQTGTNQDLWQDLRFVWQLRAHAIANPFGDRLVVAGQYRDGNEARIWLSDDRGATWKQSESAAVAASEWKSMQFLCDNPQIGWVAGGTYVSGKSRGPHWSRVMKTTDGGQAWETKLAVEENGPIQDIDFLNEQEGLTVGLFGNVYRTENGGETWEAFTVDGSDGFAACRWQGPGVVWAVDCNGALFRSADSGREGTWEMLFGGTINVRYYDIEIDTARGHIFCAADVDDGGCMKISTDGGLTFREVTEPFEKSGGLFSVRLGPDGRVYASSGTGNVYVGEEVQPGTWIWTKAAKRVCRFGNLYSMLPISENEWYVAGGSSDSAVVARTEDGGESWYLLPDGGYNVMAMDFLFHEPSGRIVMVGDWGTIQYSEDGGSTWHPVFWPSPYTTDDQVYWCEIAADDEGEIWVVGKMRYMDGVPEGLILKSQDGGDTWSFEGFLYFEFYCIELIGAERIRIGGYCQGDYGIVLVSNNDGASFYYTEPAFCLSVRDLMFTSETTGWAVGPMDVSVGGIYKTTDSGNTWQLVGQTPKYGQLQGIWMDDNERGLAVGVRNTMAGTLNGDKWVTLLEPVLETPNHWDVVFHRPIRTTPGGLWITGWYGPAAISKPDEDGFIVRRDGDWTQWTPDIYLVKRPITKAREFGDEIWATGYNGMLLKRPLRPKPETLTPTAPW